VKFSLLADVYKKIEDTTKRLEMTSHMAELLKRTPKDVVDKVVYLTQGKLGPGFVSMEMGIAEKLAVQIVARATGEKEEKIRDDLAKTGDIGETTQRLLKRNPQVTLFKRPELSFKEVYDTFERIARTSGTGSIDKKINNLAGLLSCATPNEAKYVMRIVTGTLRLGIADMTILDAMAIAFGEGRDAREPLERAYNISSDLGKVARSIVERGIEEISQFKVILGNPIRPMLAERLGSPDEILEKLGGKCIAEFKYDGERIQAHKQGSTITLFSRRLEDITSQYPDAVELLKENIKAKKAIIEAECVAVDLDTGELRSFQDLMHRRRKYGVEEAMAEYPISLFVFDVLYAEGEDYTLSPYLARHRKLEQIVIKADQVQVAKYAMVDSTDELERFFEESIEAGCEGLMCKSVAENSVYHAGARGWLWIKYKREYKGEMTDTIDLVVVGAFHGRGRRAGKYGALLLATYNPSENQFETITKCGTGFTDEDLNKLLEMMKRHQLSQRHHRVKSLLKADEWFIPAVVIEVLGSEVTLSPIHTSAMNKIRKGSGLAIRFPRFTGNYRLDKSPEDATTDHEMVSIYKQQLKR